MDESFAFDFDRVAGVLLPLVGVRPSTACVRLDDDGLHVRFGAWRLDTPLSNVRDASLTGPYMWVRAVGLRLSMADRGITFGTNARAGVCVRFRKPVACLAPWSGLRHPGMTATVEDPPALLSALTRGTFGSRAGSSET